MNIKVIIVTISSLLLLMVGADKFIGFLEPPCSLMDTISPALWKLLGVIQILGGILIWNARSRKLIVGFFLAFMLFFTAYHLINNTTDVGGAMFMAVLMGLLFWNPEFINKGQASKGNS